MRDNNNAFDGQGLACVAGVSTRFAAEDFLDDVRYLIRQKYGNQGAFAKRIPVSRNVVSRVINNPERLDTYWVNLFAIELNMDLRSYIIL